MDDELEGFDGLAAVLLGADVRATAGVGFGVTGAGVPTGFNSS
jgi:hypothetical protein